MDIKLKDINLEKREKGVHYRNKESTVLSSLPGSGSYMSLAKNLGGRVGVKENF